MSDTGDTCDVPREHADAANSEVRDTFELFRNYLDKKLASLKREFSEESDNLSDKTFKKLKEDNSIKLKYVGNRLQFELNSELESDLDSLEKCMSKKDFKKGSEILELAKQKIHKRNKLIRFAVKSLGGWETVHSEDEKRIKKAELRALRNIKSRKNDSACRKPSATVSSAHTDKRVSGRQYFQNLHPIRLTGNNLFVDLSNFLQLEIPTVDRHMTYAICVDDPATGGETVKNLEQTRQLQTRNKDIND
ncbi:hypothetical protein KUTeg_024803, partial [Tegillarca granosa]